MPPIDMAQYMRNRRRKRKALMLARLGGKCVVCGKVDSLEFDHVDPLSKVKEVSSAIMLDGPLERLIEEVDKCQLLCTEHHIEKSKPQLKRLGGHNRIDNPSHGTAVVYATKCRCDACKTWKRRYRAKEVDARGNLIPI